MKINNILFNLFVIITVLSNLIILTSLHNIALSFEPEFDEKGFIINDPEYLPPRVDESIPEDTSFERPVFPEENSFSLNSNSIKIGELTSCLDYPKLGSVSLDLVVNQDNFKAGEDLIIEGEIINNNSYPVADASVYARLVKNIDNPVYRRASTITIDEFNVASNINLNSNSSYSINNTYKLPNNLVTGDYKLLLYVYSSNQFNLNGLTFSESFYGSLLEFTVTGENNDYVYIDKTNINVNGKSYDTLSSNVQVDIGEVNIESNLVNETNENREVKVNYQLYHWDSTFQDNIIQSKEEVYNIDAGQKIPIKYTLDNASNPVYELKITSSSLQNESDSYKSIANVRFETNNTLRPRLHFVGLDSYPITKDSKLITCIHNTSSEIDNGPIKVITTLKNNRNRELGRIEYNGPISSTIEGFASKVKSVNWTEVIKLESVLYNNQGIEIDRIVIDYDCNQFNPEICDQINDSLVDNNILIIISILLLIAVIIILKWSHIKQYIIRNK